MFEFQLDSLSSIATSARSLSWWQLSAGVFFIELGDARLFHLRLDDDEADSVRPWLVGSWRGAFDFFVASLSNRLGDVLPVLLEPVPHDIARTVPRLLDLHDDDDVDDEWSERDELRERASMWFWTRTLDPGPSPARVQIWRVGQTVHFRWDNTDMIGDDGRCVWSAPAGAHDMPLDDFIVSVDRFVRTLGHQMRRRIDSACCHPWSDGVRPDVDALLQQHDQALRHLERGFDLRHRRPTDWAAVRTALRELDLLI